jgi:hypothetical protein
MENHINEETQMTVNIIDWCIFNYAERYLANTQLGKAQQVCFKTPNVYCQGRESNIAHYAGLKTIQLY